MYKILVYNKEHNLIGEYSFQTKMELLIKLMKISIEMECYRPSITAFDEYECLKGYIKVEDFL